jgi:hypothetical protein
MLLFAVLSSEREANEGSNSSSTSGTGGFRPPLHAYLSQIELHNNNPNNPNKVTTHAALQGGGGGRRDERFLTRVNAKVPTPLVATKLEISLDIGAEVFAKHACGPLTRVCRAIGQT